MAKENFVTEIWDDLVNSISNIRSGSNMPRYLPPNMPCLFGRDLQVCDFCCVKLTLFKRKRLCCRCRKVFCNQCIAPSPDKTVQCRICMVLFMRPPDKKLLLQLRVKDLQSFLTAHHVSTHGCVEKEDLVNLLLHYTSQRPMTGNNPGFSPDATSSMIPDEVGSEAGETTNSAAGAGANLSSPILDSAPTELRVATSYISDEEHKNSDLPTGETSEENDDGAVVAMVAGTSSANFTDPRENDVAPPSADLSGFMQLATSADLLGPSTSANRENLGENLGEMLGEALGHSLEETLGETLSESLRETLSQYLSSTPPGSPNPSQTESASRSPVFVRPSMSAIRTVEDMEQMSVKQLKCILARHRVDYHGCCEKAELVERATRLWKDYRASRADLDNLDLDELCKVCMDAPIECVMLECGHMATCTDCGRQLCECPICRQYVVRIVRTFRA